VARFTTLFRAEHEHEHDEQRYKRALVDKEQVVEDKYGQLIDAIRARYHEEQLWSDKMRSVSAYGTLALMLVQVTMFIGVQAFVEPHKRSKLTQEIVEQVVASQEGMVRDVVTREQLAELAEQLTASMEETKVVWTVPTEPSPLPPPPPSTWPVTAWLGAGCVLGFLLYPLVNR
jgi:hypothetical protein